MPIVLYGVGSAIVADVEETCARLGLRIAAWVKNVDGPTFESAGRSVVRAEDISEDLAAHEFIVPLFTPGHRREASEDARHRGFVRPATLVDPTAIVASSTTFEAGCYLNSAVNVGAAGHIGKFVFINRGASIGHHAMIGDFVSIGPGAVIAGNVRLGRGAVVGAGAVVIPEIEIGTNAVVGAGAVVTNPVPPHCLVVGNPARVTKPDIAGYNDRSA
jgi:sugar O-acyltransferase (sialic acid O-acetyltransferase NeuD family)